MVLVDDIKNDVIEDQAAEDVQQQVTSEESLAKGMKVVQASFLLIG